MKKIYAFFLTVFLLSSLIFSGTMLSAQSTIHKTGFVPDRILVKLKNEIPWKFPEIQSVTEWDKTAPLHAEWNSLQKIAKAYGVHTVTHPFRSRSEAMDRTFQFTFSEKEQIEVLIKALSNLSFIEYAEKEPVFYPSYIPNDYNAGQQYYIGLMDVPQAWDLTKGDTNVVIGVIDVAFMTGHQDLAANMFRNWIEINGTQGVDDDGNGYVDDIMGWDAGNGDNNTNPLQVNNFDHGTHVAGCASAVADNNVGVAGIGFKCKISPIKAKSDQSISGSGLDATLAGMDYAVASRNVDIVNMSFGGAGGYSNTWQNLLDLAYQKGMIVIAAAGNDNTLADTYYPASYNHVICVGATNANDQKSWFSNYGATIDVMAPGSSIKSTTLWGINPPAGGYASWDGTSMAAPIVAGVAALMLSANPGLSPDALENCLKQSCENINAQNSGYIGQMGAGRVNAFQAVSCVIPSVAPVAGFTYTPVTVCDGVVSFTSQSTNLVTGWQWDFGNGQSSSMANPSVAFGNSGTYNVSLIVSNPVGSDTITQQVTVNALVVPVVDAGTSVEVCYGEAIQLNGSTSLPGTIFWSPNAGLSGNGTLNPVLTPTQSKTYSLTVTHANGCIGTDTVQITVNPNPTLYAGADLTMNPGDSVTLAAVASNNLSFLWTPSTGLNDATLKNPTAKPLVTTLYTLTVTNSFGCSKSDDVLVTVIGTIDIDSPESPFSLLESYPNPFEESVIFHAVFKHSDNLKLEIFDVTGKQLAVLYEGKTESGDFEKKWNPSALSSGVYFVKWQTLSGTFVQKLVKY